MGRGGEEEVCARRRAAAEQCGGGAAAGRGRPLGPGRSAGARGAKATSKSSKDLKTMATTATVHGAHDENGHAHPTGWRRFVYSTNHKDIGTMYLAFALGGGL